MVQGSNSLWGWGKGNVVWGKGEKFLGSRSSSERGVLSKHYDYSGRGLALSHKNSVTAASNCLEEDISRVLRGNMFHRFMDLKKKLFENWESEEEVASLRVSP